MLKEKIKYKVEEVDIYTSSLIKVYEVMFNNIDELLEVYKDKRVVSLIRGVAITSHKAMGAH